MMPGGYWGGYGGGRKPEEETAKMPTTAPELRVPAKREDFVATVVLGSDSRFTIEHICHGHVCYNSDRKMFWCTRCAFVVDAADGVPRHPDGWFADRAWFCPVVDPKLEPPLFLELKPAGDGTVCLVSRPITNEEWGEYCRKAVRYRVRKALESHKK